MRCHAKDSIAQSDRPKWFLHHLDAKGPQCSSWRNPPCYVEWLVPHLPERHSSGEALHANGTWNTLGETKKNQKKPKNPPFFLSKNVSLKFYPFILWYCWSPWCTVKPTTQLLGKILGSQEQRQEICQALQDVLFAKIIARRNRFLQLITGLAQFAFQVNLPPEQASIQQRWGKSKTCEVWRNEVSTYNRNSRLDMPWVTKSCQRYVHFSSCCHGIVVFASVESVEFSKGSLAPRN